MRIIALISVLMFCSKLTAAMPEYDQMLVLAGDKHRLSAFMPHFSPYLSQKSSVEFYGMNVNPNRGDHILDKKRVIDLVDKKFDQDKKLLVVAWSISAKLVIDLVDEYVNIDRVIMFDPMDGSPPLSKNSERRPKTTTRSLSRTDIKTLIIKAEKSHLSYSFLAPICDIPSQNYKLFVEQYQRTDLQVKVIRNAGHLSLIYGRFGLGARFACRETSLPKAIALYEVSKTIERFMKEQSVNEKFKTCYKYQHRQRLSLNAYCIDGKIQTDKFLKRVNNP